MLVIKVNCVKLGVTKKLQVIFVFTTTILQFAPASY